jgi:translation initiation factor 2B subunit (eIF-2B alpha/beta/delta family)
MAEALADAGVRVEMRTDAALAGALPGCDGLLVGADALAPAWFLKKCGTLPLAAAAGLVGAGVYVLATRDKVVDPEVGELLRVREHEAREVWDGAPPGVTICNPYFERVPMALATAVITDGGVRVAGG